MPVIRLPLDVYKRLEKHAKGFDTPASTIERLLNAYEGIKEEKSEVSLKEAPGILAKPVLSFSPNEEKFRAGLVKGKEARVVLHYLSGETEEKVWSPSRFSESSNLRANIWSGFLRGWQEKCIVKADFYIK